MAVRARCVAVAVSVVVALALALPASAGPATDTLRRHIDRIFAALADPQMKGPSNAARRQRLLRAYAEEALDFREAARRTLGPHWDARTPEERARFVQLFTDLIDQAYLARLSYDGERVVYETETVAGDEAVVHVRAVGASGRATPVQFRLVRDVAGHWRVYDVAFEGMSLVGSYRAQFNKIIRGSSFADLVSRLEHKIRTDAQASTGDTPSGAP